MNCYFKIHTELPYSKYPMKGNVAIHASIHASKPFKQHDINGYTLQTANQEISPVMGTKHSTQLQSQK